MQIGVGFTLAVPVAPAPQNNTPGPRRVADQQTERPVTETGSTEPRQREEVRRGDEQTRRDLEAADRREQRRRDDEDRRGEQVDIRV